MCTMSFRPGGAESDDDDFIDFGEYIDGTGPTTLEPGTDSLSRVSRACGDGAKGPQTTGACDVTECDRGSSQLIGRFDTFEHSVSSPLGCGEGRRGGEVEEGGDVGRKGRELEQGEELRVAIAHGNPEAVRRILNEGFPPNAILKSRWSALMFACDAGNSDVVETLLDCGANPNTQSDHFTALMALCCSSSVSEEGLVKCARLLLNKGARVNAHDRHLTTALLYASQHERCALAQLLIDANAAVNQQDAKGWTALAYAAMKGSQPLAQLLLSAGADMELSTSLGDTPAGIAYSEGHTSLVEILESAASTTTAVPGGVDDVSLPPHPLLGSDSPSASAAAARNHRSGTAPARSSSSSSSRPRTFPPSSSSFSSSRPQALPPSSSSSSSPSTTHHYGDLELFLAGLGLTDMVPLFTAHRVRFNDLLTMTDRDLEQVGIAQVGVRKRILDSVAGVHRKPWRMPKDSIGLSSSRNISSAEASVVLSNLATHATYIKSTATFLLRQAEANPDFLDPNMEERETDSLMSELSGTVAAVGCLGEEVDSLKAVIEKALGRRVKDHSANKATEDTPPRSRTFFSVIRLIGAVVVIGCGTYILLKVVSQKTLAPQYLPVLNT